MGSRLAYSLGPLRRRSAKENRLAILPALPRGLVPFVPRPPEERDGRLKKITPPQASLNPAGLRGAPPAGGPYPGVPLFAWGLGERTRRGVTFFVHPTPPLGVGQVG